MAKTITLGRSGLVAIVDDEDYDRLVRDRWTFNGGYAARYLDRRKILMHREILGLPRFPGKLSCSRIEADHKNHDCLDNRKCNLRRATHGQNMMNRRASYGHSQYKGVTYEPEYYHQAFPWRARIGVGGRRITIGRFPKEREAAEAYDQAARQLHGEFALLNFRAA